MNNVFNVYSGILTGGWVGVYFLMRKISPKPVAFSKDDAKTKERETEEYYSNWPAFIHAVLMVFLCKYCKNNLLQLLFVSSIKCLWRRTGLSTFLKT